MSGYKAKTISIVITRKIDAWIASIEDEALRTKLKDGVVVTGGCIASMLLGEKVNDFDVYLRSLDLAQAVAEYYVKRFTPKAKKGIPCKMSVQRRDDRVKIVVKSAGIASNEGTEESYEYFESRPPEEAEAYVGDVIAGVSEDQDDIDDIEQEIQNGLNTSVKPVFKPVFLSSNAITLSDKIQIVLRFCGEPDEIHGNYDFVHCTCYWTSWGVPKLVLRPEAMEAMLARELRYVGSKYPLCSIIRTRKFLKRNWTINTGQYLKMIMQCGELDLKDPRVLEDQLTGVDVAYFAQLLGAIKEDNPQVIDAAYVVQIVDRMF